MVDEKYFQPNNLTINKTFGEKKWAGIFHATLAFLSWPPLKIRPVQKRLFGARAGGAASALSQRGDQVRKAPV